MPDLGRIGLTRRSRPLDRGKVKIFVFIYRYRFSFLEVTTHLLVKVQRVAI